MKWSEFVKKCRTGYPASIPVIVAHIQKYLMENPIDTETIIQTIIEYIEAHPDLYPIDDELSTTSENPVQNKIITAALENVTIPVDDELSSTSENPVQNKVITAALENVTVPVDDELSSTSENPVQNKVINQALNNIPVITVDSALSTTSENPVQNKVINQAINSIPVITVDSALSTTSENPVQNKVIKEALDNIPGVTVDTALSTTSENPVQNKIITNALAGKVSADVLDIQITASNPAMWSDGSSQWPGNNAPLGQSGTCYLATVTSGTGVSSCVDGDDFKPSEYSQARCPAPLWVYIGNATVYVATTTPPTENITIRGLVLHQ